MRSKKDIAWEKAKEVPDKDPDVWRCDKQGHLIRYASYGKTDKYSWKVDNKIPIAIKEADIKKDPK